MQVCSTMKVTVLLLVTCELCWTIRVPVAWDKSESDVEQDAGSDAVFSVESFKPRGNAEAFNTYDRDSSELKSQHSGESIRAQNKKPIPIEYFEYTAKKPQFAVDVAAFHGVQSPENHYKAYPIRPYTDKIKLELGKHKILDSKNTLYKPFQEYTKINEDVGTVPSSYEAFHPYEAETQALQEIYKDPVLNKIRSNLENSRVRLQQYEKDAGEADVTKEEYLESPQITDSKLFPHRQQLVPFEIHRPQRRPVYYRPRPVHNSREQYLNQKLRYPLNHNIAKVRPMHYRPLKNHIHQLRQSHSLKYDDERNEYPEVQISENYSDPKDGLDIYERGKDKFVQLRNNVDESVNRAVKDNRPSTYEKLEFQDSSTSNDEKEKDYEEEFIPIKNYAQVRRTEIFKHLPRAAALEDAETSDEIKNSPRLREAVKSTKAQTVYSEEGYEDAAYDHAGEQKHASENEGHGGFLKEKELSGGKYKTPSVSASFEDGKGDTYKDIHIHAKKWNDDNKDTKEEADEEDYADDEHEHLLEADNHQTELQDDANHRNKRENVLKNETLFSSDIQMNNTKDTLHEVDKREVNFEVPQIDLNSTFFNDSEFLKIAKLRGLPKKDTIKQKYPYYYKNLKTISEHSPLRYAENLKFIPKKSKGGTEFYDSRSKFECPEVDDVPDPVPEKLRDEGQPSEDNDSSKIQSSTQGDKNFDTTKKQPRLSGLGDKIDCFKAKYFGENPLDSPFFKEDIISNPEPAFLPNIAAYKLKMPSFLEQKGEKTAESNYHNVFEKPQERNTSDLLILIEKLKNDQNALQNSTIKYNNDFVFSLVKPSSLNNSKLVDQSNVYDDIIKNIKTSLTSNVPLNYFNNNISEASNISNQSQPSNNITYTYFQDKEEITQPPTSRKKRAAPFVYEPYKIIKDGQIQDDTKKTIVASNISPLIRQLQSSKIMDTVVNLSPNNAQHVKRNVNSRAYKNIGQKDREIKYGFSKNDKSYEDSDIVDMSVDKRRGEPRYEIIHENHKPKYTPITNTKSMTKKDYEAQISNDETSRGESSIMIPTRFKRPTEKPNFVVLKFMPQKAEIQKNTPSYTSREPVVRVTSSLEPQITASYDKKEEQDKHTGSKEDYEEYDEDELDNDKKTNIISTTTTSTTLKPVLRRKTRLRTTTQEPLGFIEEPKLRLVTRFRDYKPKDNQEIEYHPIQRSINNSNTVKTLKGETVKVPDENIAPKIREKKKKISKSTIVTDTKKYGDAVEDDDKIMKDEVDALIGVTIHDMTDYVPNYEKDMHKERILKEADSIESNKNTENNGDADEDEENDDKSDDVDDEDADYDDDDDDDDDDDNTEDDDVSISDEEDLDIEIDVTTSEPTKRTLVIMTDAPFSTTASRSAKLQAKPIITKKKIQIHNELPVNKSSPNITEFKQDIKEIEIIKETRNPLKKKPNKNVEVLDLYKDDNLAKDINKLGVEIFKENLDLRQGPKHGGNYRNAAPSSVSTRRKVKQSKDDAETSQSKNTKHIEVDDETWRSDDSTSLRRQNSMSRGENSKLIGVSDTPNTGINGGNLNYRVKSRNTNAKNQKLVELDDDEHEEDTSSDSLKDNSYGILRRERPMHGGNYRSAKLTLEENPPTTIETTKSRPRDAVQNAALVLNSFVQAAPVLTTTPAYILDPSKRKYYYVDA